MAQKINYRGVNMHICYKDASVATLISKSLGMTQCLGVHPRGYWLWLSIQDVPDPNDPASWDFQLQWTWRSGPKTESLATLNLENLKAEAAECFGEPYRTAWLSIAEGTKVPSNDIRVWPPSPIPQEAFYGRAALIGDAAHAMSFHRGQGLNHGTVDACRLVDELTVGDRSQKDAVLAYEAEMIRRAGEEVKLGKMNTEMMHDWERMKDSAFMQRGGDKNK